MTQLTIDSHIITITHPDKILFPEAKITKLDLVNYYAKAAQFMLPYAKDRALTMQRYPDGIYGEVFYQKDAPTYFPSWIKRKAIEKKEGGITHYVVANDPATLAYLASQACITPHLWLSKIDKIHYPDRMIFDLDPPDNNFALTIATALAIRKLLTAIELESFVLTTGSKGLHVVVPLLRLSTNDEVKTFATELASLVVRSNPENITLNMSKQERIKKLFIDVYRNNYGATAVAPFAVRAKPEASVATPLHWHELADKKLTARSYTMNNIFQRIASIEDPWKDMAGIKQSIKKASKLLAKLSQKA